MSWVVLRPQFGTLLTTLTDIQEVKTYPTLKFNGYPSAYVVPSTNSGDYETNRENIRTYAFIVRIFYTTKDVGVAQALTALEGIVDQVLDAFDKQDLKDSSTRILGKSLPAGYTYLNVWASPSDWAEIPDENLMMAEVTVRIRVSVDIS